MGSSRFRPVYRQLDDATKARVAAIKEKAWELATLIEGDPDEDSISVAADVRCKALAMTNLEQAVMWAVKAVT